VSAVTAVFLDRDGTLNVKAPAGGYITSPVEMRLLPGAAAAVRALNVAGVPVVLVTNQRGIALGVLNSAGYEQVTERLVEQLAEHGATLDAVYVCPHERGVCGCRKPAPGMLLQAAREHPAIDLARAVMVGDSEADVEAGSAAGTATVRIAESTVTTCADFTAPDLAGAVAWILREG